MPFWENTRMLEPVALNSAPVASRLNMYSGCLQWMWMLQRIRITCGRVFVSRSLDSVRSLAGYTWDVHNSVFLFTSPMSFSWLLERWWVCRNSCKGYKNVQRSYTLLTNNMLQDRSTYYSQTTNSGIYGCSVFSLIHMYKRVARSFNALTHYSQTTVALLSM